MKDTIILEGRNTVHDALLSDKNIETIYIGKTSRNDQRVREIIELANRKNVPIRYVYPEQIRSLTGNNNAQNVVAYMSAFENLTLKKIIEKKQEEGKDPLILLLNRIDFEQNLGAIMRSSWGADVDAIIASPNGVHELTPVVAKVSMGAAAYVPLIGQSLFQAIATLKDFGIPVVGVEVGMGKSYSDITLLGPVAFLFGGEADGISEPLIKQCDTFIHIPQNKELASLNVSVAVALTIYEKRRQEREAANE